MNRAATHLLSYAFVAALVVQTWPGAKALATAFAGSTATPRVDVLVVEHTPIGVVERTGYLAAWKYTGTAMFVEFTDDGDELFHNSFEAPPTCP